MISFCEGRPYNLKSESSEKVVLCPQYMLKDGKKLFLFNRWIPDDEYTERKLTNMKQQLYIQ